MLKYIGNLNQLKAEDVNKVAVAMKSYVRQYYNNIKNLDTSTKTKRELEEIVNAMPVDVFFYTLLDILQVFIPRLRYSNAF